jgi:hypothetical protein
MFVPREFAYLLLKFNFEKIIFFTLTKKLIVKQEKLLNYVN